MWHLSLLLVLSLMLSNQQVCKCAAGLTRWKTLIEWQLVLNLTSEEENKNATNLAEKNNNNNDAAAVSASRWKQRYSSNGQTCVCVCVCARVLRSCFHRPDSAYHTHTHTHIHTHTHTHSHSPPFKMSPRWSMRWWWKCHLVLIHLSSLIQPHEFLPLVFNHFCSFTTRPFECGDS